MKSKLKFWTPKAKIKTHKTNVSYNVFKKVKQNKPLKSNINFKLNPKYFRTPSEKKLIKTNPWGDKDGDLVPNWVDCKPYNRMKQGKSKFLIKQIGQQLWGRDPSKKKIINLDTEIKKDIYNGRYYTEWDLAKDIAKKPEHIEKFRDVKMVPGPSLIKDRLNSFGQTIVSSNIKLGIEEASKYKSKEQELLNQLKEVPEGHSLMGISPVQLKSSFKGNREDASSMFVLLHEVGHKEDSKKYGEKYRDLPRSSVEDEADRLAAKYLQESKNLRTNNQPAPEILGYIDQGTSIKQDTTQTQIKTKKPGRYISPKERAEKYIRYKLGDTNIVTIEKERNLRASAIGEMKDIQMQKQQRRQKGSEPYVLQEGLTPQIQKRSQLRRQKIKRIKSMRLPKTDMPQSAQQLFEGIPEYNPKEKRYQYTKEELGPSPMQKEEDVDLLIENIKRERKQGRQPKYREDVMTYTYDKDTGETLDYDIKEGYTRNPTAEDILVGKEEKEISAEDILKDIEKEDNPVIPNNYETGESNEEKK
jgi:hypothetical protein